MQITDKRMVRKILARYLVSATILVLLIVLVGCASYYQKPLSAQANATRFSQRSLENTGLRAFLQAQLGHPIALWPPKTWTLKQLTLLAFYYSPELALARAHWASARAESITAGAYPNPALQFLPKYVGNVSNMSPWTIGLSVSVPILTAGRRSYRIAEALDQAESARLDVNQTAWHIRANVRQVLIKLYAARRRVVLLAAQVQDASALLNAFRQRFAAGLASQFQVIQARLQWTNAQLSYQAAKASESHARTTLAGVVSVPTVVLRNLRYDFDAVQKLPVPNRLPVARFKTYALTQRPDIRAALMRYAASQQALKLEIARQYPNLYIGPGYQWDQGAHKWSIGFSFSLPIFNQNQGPIAQARAQRNKLAAQFRVLQERITTRFNNALADYLASYHRLALMQHLLKASEARLASVHATYQAGEASRVGLLRTKLETYGDRLALFQARLQAEQALATLEDALEHSLHHPTVASRAIGKVALLLPISTHNLSAEAVSP